MMWKEINPQELDRNLFHAIANEWMLITAGTADSANAMTASWGGTGFMWGKNVAFAVIRPQRHTKQFVDAQERFTLSFYDEKYRDTLMYMGRISGKDEDKIAKSGLTLTMIDDTPAFSEANMVMVCRKMFAQPMVADSFIDPEVQPRWYPTEDYHTLYIAEIEKVYVR